MYTSSHKYSPHIHTYICTYVQYINCNLNSTYTAEPKITDSTSYLLGLAKQSKTNSLHKIIFNEEANDSL